MLVEFYAANDEPIMLLEFYAANDEPNKCAANPANTKTFTGLRIRALHPTRCIHLTFTCPFNMFKAAQIKSPPHNCLPIQFVSIMFLCKVHTWFV